MSRQPTIDRNRPGRPGRSRSWEKEIIRRVRDGDGKAFGEFVREFEDHIYRYAFKVCRDRQKAEEALQDTFINVFNGINKFDGRSQLTTWMYRIVTNNCLMKHRAGRRRHQAVFIEDLPTEPAQHSERIAPPPVSPLEHVISGELRSAMDRAIEKLPIAHRLVFVLRDLEGLSSEETAGVLKISVEAVKSRLRRSRAFLREQLKDFVAS